MQMEPCLPVVKMLALYFFLFRTSISPTVVEGIQYV